MKNKYTPGEAQSLVTEETPENVKYYIENWQEFWHNNVPSKQLVKVLGFLDNNKNDNDVCINIGSNCGNWINIIKNIYPQQTLICFEPNPGPYKHTYNRSKQYDKVVTHQVAISNTNGRANFYDWVVPQDNSVNALGGLKSGGKKICEVSVCKLDAFLYKEFAEMDRTKVLIIDTEGHEWNVFTGALNMLNKTDYIIHENSNCLSDHRGPEIPNPICSIVNLLDSKGFDTYKIGSKKLIQLNGIKNWHSIYEEFTFTADCFSIKKNNNVIDKIINRKTGEYLNVVTNMLKTL